MGQMTPIREWHIGLFAIIMIASKNSQKQQLKIDSQPHVFWLAIFIFSCCCYFQFENIERKKWPATQHIPWLKTMICTIHGKRISKMRSINKQIYTFSPQRHYGYANGITKIFSNLNIVSVLCGERYGILLRSSALISIQTI